MVGGKSLGVRLLDLLFLLTVSVSSYVYPTIFLPMSYSSERIRFVLGGSASLELEVLYRSVRSGSLDVSYAEPRPWEYALEETDVYR